MESTKDLTVKEVAAEIRRCPATVRSMIKSKKLEGYKLGPDYRVPLAALDRYRAANSV